MFHYGIAPGFNILGMRADANEIEDDSADITEEGTADGTVQELRELRPGIDDVLFMTLAGLKITDTEVLDTIALNTKLKLSMVSDRIMGYAREALREWKEKRSCAMAAGSDKKRKTPISEDEHKGHIKDEGLRSEDTYPKNTKLEEQYATVYAELRRKYNITEQLPSIHEALVEDDPKSWKHAMTGRNRGFWLKAAYDEMIAIVQMGVFDNIPEIPTSTNHQFRKALPAKWVLLPKEIETGKSKSSKHDG
ncbi:hypothetical protein BGX38DRAFT_1227185 [Terfezia claveryi]|nr:hypothetical protein BGX38DRAFT_1227185 [Terfezia claveryi]